MQDSTLEGKQSLEVIQQMIEQSRHNFRKEAPYFLIWGWTVLIGALGHYALLHVELPFNPAWIWPIVIVTAYILYITAIVKNQKSEQRTTFIDRCMAGIWMGITGPLIITLIIGFQFSWGAAYPALIAVCGWGTFTTGFIMQFRPLIIGGILSFPIALGALFVQSAEILLILALAVVVTYLIPGYLLKNIKSERA